MDAFSWDANAAEQWLETAEDMARRTKAEEEGNESDGHVDLTKEEIHKFGEGVRVFTVRLKKKYKIEIV